jgi:predicted MFS family arabinose efflux permease
MRGVDVSVASVSRSAYGRLARQPGLLRLATASITMGVAQTMTPVAYVLFVRGVTHSYARASLVLAASTAGGLLLGPARGRLVDRIGARNAVLALLVPDLATDVLFLFAGRAHAGTLALVVLALFAGAVTAPAFAALRAVWSRTLAGTGLEQTGFALMAVLMETDYIAGPLIAGVTIALASPAAAVALRAVLSAAGAGLFAAGLARERPVRPPHGAHRLAALASPGMRTLVGAAAAFGITFGLLDVAFPAAARARGSAATAGILLSAFAGGSWLGSLLYGLRENLTPAGARYPRACLLAAAGFMPVIFVPGLGGLIVFTALSGLLFAPASVSQIATIDGVVIEAHRSEAYSWLGTAYGSGLAAGAAVSGQLIALSGVRASLAAACAAAALAAVVAWLGRASLVPGSP